MKILFLDVDGVLNSLLFFRTRPRSDYLSDDRLDLQAIERLNRITDETGAKIVVSSTWRLPYVWNNQLAMLIVALQKTGIKGEIIGMTPDHQTQYGRGGEIQDWMNNCGLQIDSFVILDDDSDMDHLTNHLVQTKFVDGLQDNHVEAAIKILKPII